MPKNKLTLESLRTRFLGQYIEEYLHHFFELIYDKYQEELLFQFKPYYEELLETFKPEKREEIEMNLFEYDFMNNICNYLNLSFLIYKLSYEQTVSENGEPLAVALLYFDSEKEKIAKEKMLKDKSEKDDIKFFIIYLNMDMVKGMIDSLMLQPKTIIGMAQSKSEFLSDHYEKRLRSLHQSIGELKKDAEHGKKFKGKPLSPENKKMYQDILDIQNKLLKEFGPGQRASLTNSVRVYNKRNNLFWGASKIRSTSETVRILRENNRI